MIIDTPGKLKSKLDLSTFDIRSPKSIGNVVSDRDYEVGYLKRYFITNVNYSNIKEVSSAEYARVDRVLFNRVTVNWKITGPTRNVIENLILQEMGVYEHNTKTIKLARKTFPGVDLLLTDPLQYWRGH
jgi:hypothetical protein